MSSTKILIVEDERIVALSIQNKLERLGYTVTANVASAEAAMASIVPNFPHLVLMDIKLKGKVDGIEAAAQIRNSFKLPIVYLTAYNDEETIERAKLTEPYGYLLKPFASRDLATTIEIALYKHLMEQKLRDREQWLATTLNSIGDAVIATNPQGAIVFMNPVAEAITGWKQEEVLNRDLSYVFQTIHETTRDVVENPVSIALKKCITVGMANSTLLITRDGREIPIDDSAAPIKNEAGDILGAVLVFHDVTEQRKIQSILEQTNEELELRVADSTAQLREANAQLKAEIAQRQQLENKLYFALSKEREINDLKSRIVATISHEYRTPLTTILSSTELLENYGDTWSHEKKQRHFERIQESVHHLTKLVNDMIFIEQAQTKKLDFHPAPLNVKTLARELVDAFRRELTDEYSIVFQYQGTFQNAFLDRDLLQIIISNLLSNAIKYSPDGGEILLELIEKESQLAIRVSDKGIGIPAKDQPHLFQSLFRGSNIDMTPGVGLGLVMVKESVDLHGGKISVQSEVGVGTTFTVILPFASGLEARS